MTTRFRLLLVEDEKSISDLLYEVIQSWDIEGAVFEFTAVERGDAAFIQMNEKPFDLIILDHFLEGVLGQDLLISMRKPEHVNRRTPVILTSGYENPLKDDKLAASLQPLIFLRKPFDPVLLKKQIEPLVKSLKGAA